MHMCCRDVPQRILSRSFLTKMIPCHRNFSCKSNALACSFDIKAFLEPFKDFLPRNTHPVKELLLKSVNNTLPGNFRPKRLFNVARSPVCLVWGVASWATSAAVERASCVLKSLPAQ